MWALALAEAVEGEPVSRQVGSAYKTKEIGIVVVPIHGCQGCSRAGRHHSRRSSRSTENLVRSTLGSTCSSPCMTPCTAGDSEQVVDSDSKEKLPDTTTDICTAEGLANECQVCSSEDMHRRFHPFHST